MSRMPYIYKATPSQHSNHVQSRSSRQNTFLFALKRKPFFIALSNSPYIYKATLLQHFNHLHPQQISTDRTLLSLQLHHCNGCQRSFPSLRICNLIKAHSRVLPLNLNQRATTSHHNELHFDVPAHVAWKSPSLRA